MIEGGSRVKQPGSPVQMKGSPSISDHALGSSSLPEWLFTAMIMLLACVEGDVL